jgi:hypothetical protein
VPVRSTHWLFISLALYAVSFVAPYQSDTPGAVMFYGGLIFCWLIPYTYAWWANPIYWYALVLAHLKKWPNCASFSLVATMLAGLHLPGRRDDGPLGPAFFLWVGSMAVLAVLAIVQSAIRRPEEPPTKASIEAEI